MKQLTFVEPGKLEWREAAEPRLEGDGEAIVRPVALATCDLDAMIVRGRAPVEREFAFGHE
ncbi:MAG: dehydrogenase, partial [Solirubrobacterales bacterium]